jgi:hypothetical protein
VAHPDALTAYAAAIFPETTIETLTALLDAGDVELRRLIAQRSYLPLPIVERLIDDPDEATRDAIASYLHRQLRQSPVPENIAEIIKLCAQLRTNEAVLIAARHACCTRELGLLLAAHDHGVVALSLLDRFTKAGPDPAFATAICELWAPRMAHPTRYVGTEAVMVRVLPLATFSESVASCLEADFAVLAAPGFVTAGLSPDMAATTRALARNNHRSIAAVRAAAAMLLAS